MFGPLTFQNNPTTRNNVQEAKCLLCEDRFNLNISRTIFLKHVFETHNLIIEDVQHIENLDRYVTYWREKFIENTIDELVPTLKIDSTNKAYFLLSKLIKEDAELRHKIKLDHALSVQEFERIDNNYHRLCLFCKLEFKGTRSDFIGHLFTVHNVQLGNPQNLVFIDDLVETIDKKLRELKCLYCDKTFPDRTILKEHMRKKLHKQINPSCTEFDKFYIVNYLESGKNWQKIQKQNDQFALSTNADEEYSDWNEEEDQINCLFCNNVETDINILCLHMEADHNFDFADLTENYDFYQKVKLVNYIRRQIHNNCCPYCDHNYENVERLHCHLFEENHCKTPDDLKVFDHPEYYFPTYENDAFLYFIDDVED